MPPEHLYFGGGVAETVLSPFVALALLVAGCVICLAHRQRALAAFLSAAILIPTDQVLMLGPLHFPSLRIVAIFGLIRALISKRHTRQSAFSSGINRIDIAILVSLFVTAVNGVLLWGGIGPLIFQLGNLVTGLGLYLGLRFLIRDQGAVEQALKTFVVIAGVVAAVMTYEQATGHNPYALLGGARAFAYASVVERGNRFRSVAGFGHPILAGTFGAILLPLFVGLWWRGKKFRKYALVGAVASTIIAVTSGSNTPLMALVAGIFGLAMWPLREWMRVIRWGIVFMLVSLHMVMKAPVWNLIARVEVVGGSSGDHRYQLVNMFIRHFWDWWLIGTTSNASWGWDMWDTSNQYVAVGEAAGLVPFALLLTVIVLGFKFFGRARKAPGTNRQQALFLWSLSAGVFANVVAFFGISYFDQTIVAWYGLLAIATAMAAAQQKQAALFRLRTASDLSEEPGTLPPPDVTNLSPILSACQRNEDLHADSFTNL